MRNAVFGLVAASLLAGMAGCSTSKDESIDLGMGQQATPAAPTATASAAAPLGAVVQAGCPPISLRDGTATYRNYPKGVKDDPSKVVFQASLADSTRACAKNETNLLINVMVQGRLVSGPLGKAGPVSLPIRVAVVDGDKVVYSELTQFPITVTDPAQPNQFVFTKDNVAVPGDLSSFAKVYVGFDEGPVKTARK